MKDSVYIVCDSSGALRMTKRTPSLYRNEAAVRLTLIVPDDCFRDWSFSATVEVPGDRVIQPAIEVTAEAIPTDQEVSA